MIIEINDEWRVRGDARQRSALQGPVLCPMATVECVGRFLRGVDAGEDMEALLGPLRRLTKADATNGVEAKMNSEEGVNDE